MKRKKPSLYNSYPWAEVNRTLAGFNFGQWPNFNPADMNGWMMPPPPNQQQSPQPGGPYPPQQQQQLCQSPNPYQQQAAQQWSAYPYNAAASAAFSTSQPFGPSPAFGMSQQQAYSLPPAPPPQQQPQQIGMYPPYSYHQAPSANYGANRSYMTSPPPYSHAPTLPPQQYQAPPPPPTVAPNSYANRTY